jgi:hypothetical protein
MQLNPLAHLDLHRVTTEEHERRAERLRLLTVENDQRHGKRARKRQAPGI